MSNSNTDTGDTTVLATTNLSTVQDYNPISNEGEPVEPRESLITTAVSFLQNTKVRHTTLIQKQQFLRSKGLTSHEIQLACERAGVFSHDPNTIINIGSQLAVQHQQTAFGRLRELLYTTTLLSGVVYAVYLFWRKYIAPFLFGTPKKKSVDKALEDIDKKVETSTQALNAEISAVKDLITVQQKEQAQQMNREFSNFRSDLDAIKGLLLNRKQFASPVAPSTVPSIPAWQLASSPHRHRHSHTSQSDDNDKADDAGSGSGSSETEVVTKNSDSSLEIM
ncbi:Pex14 [Drosophila busckii]|uniref:Peroxisomal membrane protein PEX14 n=1 Tax=Drosophila busckii TaxID=30019 RepID=A0A0M4EBF2_DROBS|nr:peroxisomal membrane protein PEX14 [Drosophila busckii]ALC44778.1 Pex14 [Drosophila busckii]